MNAGFYSAPGTRFNSSHLISSPRDLISFAAFSAYTARFIRGSLPTRSSKTTRKKPSGVPSPKASCRALCFASFLRGPTSSAIALMGGQTGTKPEIGGISRVLTTTEAPQFAHRIGKPEPRATVLLRTSPHQGFGIGQGTRHSFAPVSGFRLRYGLDVTG